MTQKALKEPAAATAERPASPAKLAHVVLRTTQYEPMVQWYKTVLAAEASFEAPGAVAFLRYDDEHHRIAIALAPDAKDRPPMAAGLEHVAFTYANLADLISTYERLRSLEILPFWTINHGPTMSFYYRDPDNNQIELQVDNFETMEEVNAYLATEFPKNPIGVDFDADDLARRFHAGVPESELRFRPDVGERGLDSLPTM